MLQTCCFCLSLQTGSFIVAVYFFVVQVFYIYSYSSLIPFLKPDEREDNENKQQRERVKTKTVAWLVVTLFFCILAICIFVAVCLKKPKMLKTLAVLIVLPSVIAIIRTLVEKRSPHLFIALISETIALAITLFCAVVLWSYAEELINPPTDAVVVYVASGYGYGEYPSVADSQAPTAPSQPPGYPAMQPYPQQPYPQQIYPPHFYQQPYAWWAPQQNFAPPQTQPVSSPPQPSQTPPNQ